jgi:hypothetical protein
VLLSHPYHDESTFCMETFIAAFVECAASQLEWHRWSRGRVLNAIVMFSSLDDLHSNPSGVLKGHRVY